MNRMMRGQIGPRFLVYILGLLIMSLGIVLLIVANLGATPWDVLHVGLYYQLGLTIGSWSIIVGIVILIVSSLISKEFPKTGAYINMILIGVFIDLYLLLPFMQTPDHLFGKILMFAAGVIIYCYGMGIYISARFGTGPRDSLMMALTMKTGWKVGPVRSCMEIIVLIIGWQLGGPVFWGTIALSLSIGPIVGFALPQCQALTDRFLAHLKKEKVFIAH
ncbi:YczE/YyaS/YitT family protein [Cytobacillus purgationiresistens]|uniref:Membrane protein YczE n=1 Tax=Cytobacillus purgationiresistens TaxID=863449 RepID=A0ABU0AE93_9BACI|nr:YitT family protein [Cytobacillus purgationiresistens]MDQ0269567.1 putative membrane protein YczE [Cytobacillus purgationiresistens]